MTLKTFNQLKEKAQKIRFESSSERVDRLITLQNWIKKNEDRIEMALYKDFEKPKFESQVTEILLVLSELKYFIQKLPSWLKDKKVMTPISLAGHSSRIRFENKGVVLIISPWNYPFQLTLMPLIAALAAGNTVVIKPSELTLNMSNLLQEMCEACFSNQEVVLEQGAKDKTIELLDHHFDHVFFTGSTAVGRIIATKCAERLIPYTLELGGKSPAIVDQTAQIKDTVRKIYWGKFSNRGQACVAPDVLILHKNIKSAFMSEYYKYARTLADEKPSRIINKNHEARLVKLAQGELNLSKTHTLLIDATDDGSAIHTEEIFGPMALVYEYNTLEDIEVIYKANPNPLALYVFSEDKVFTDLIVKSFPSGGVGINTIIVQLANHNLPFGGVGSSGQGRYHGHFGFLELSHQRAILEQNLLNSSIDLLFPPYTKSKYRLIQILKKITT